MKQKLHYAYYQCPTKFRTVTDNKKKVTCLKCRRHFVDPVTLKKVFRKKVGRLKKASYRRQVRSIKRLTGWVLR